LRIAQGKLRIDQGKSRIDQGKLRAGQGKLRIDQGRLSLDSVWMNLFQARTDLAAPPPAARTLIGQPACGEHDQQPGTARVKSLLEVRRSTG
jgi:hypothetical protein